MKSYYDANSTNWIHTREKITETQSEIILAYQRMSLLFTSSPESNHTPLGKVLKRPKGPWLNIIFPREN